MNRNLLSGRSRSLAVGEPKWLLRTDGSGTFDPSVTVTSGTATWIYGDGTSETANSGSHVYATTGNYPVSWDVAPELVELIDVRDDGVTEINTRAWTNLTYLHCGSNSLTSLDTFAAWTNLTTLYCHSNSLTSLDTFAAWTNLTTLYCSSNSLPASEIDDILTTLDTAGASNGNLNYSSNPGSADVDRSGAAATSKTNLITRGWVVTI
jgi:hypothetical protein